MQSNDLEKQPLVIIKMLNDNFHETDDPMFYVYKGYELLNINNNREAEICYRKSLSLNPQLPIAHNNLGLTLQVRGDLDGAIFCYRKALEFDSTLRLALINLASLLSQLKQIKEAKLIWRKLITLYPGERKLLDHVIGDSMRDGSIEIAAFYAEEYAALNLGSKWHKYSHQNNIPISNKPFPIPFLSKDKLKHDLAQFEYLQQKGILENDVAAIINKYKSVLEVYNHYGDGVRLELNDEEHALIGDIYNRLVYVRDTPRLKSVFSDTWNKKTIEDDYLNHALGIAVVDDFLSKEALYSIRDFCLQSTIWFQNRYSYGRLGAFFRDGFNCPLLVQIANELRSAFPRIIGEKHKVLNIWGFKNSQFQPMTHAHADFAAVNVNFWLTPDDANLNKEEGGLIIYDKEAPLDWDFDSYNNQGEKIDKFLRENQAQQINIPYKANRCIIFNSDLFHKTAPLHFKEGYENRRINVTFLFGKRENSLF